MKVTGFGPGLWMLGVLFVMCPQADALQASDYCPPDGYPDYTVECWDSLGYGYGCCSADFTVCCSDAYLNIWCCPDSLPVCGDYYDESSMCLPDESTATTTASSSTTTTIADGATTTTVPVDSTTTTAADAGSSNRGIVGINITGADTARSASSGTLPGTSPAVVGLHGRGLGRLPAQMHDAGFRPLPLEFYRQAARAERAGRIRPAALQQTVGEQRSFWVKDDQDAAWRQAAAVLQRIGNECLLYVDGTLSVADATLDQYSAQFDEMYALLAENIGTYSDRDGNGKVTILLYDVNDGGTVAGYLGGYFWSKDYVEDSLAQRQGVRSNEMDIIYIRGNEPEGWPDDGDDFFDYNLTTLVHEYQHMVHFGIKVWERGDQGTFSDTWIDEMMAMASETMYFKDKLAADPGYTHPSMQGQGYLAGRIEYYNNDPYGSIRNGHGLNYWDSKGDVLANYALSYLFGQYISLHAASGQGIFKEILNYMVANGVDDYRAVSGAASENIAGITTWEDLLKSWAIANIVNAGSGLSGYLGGFALSAHGPTSDRVNVKSGGAVYRTLSGEITAPANAGRNMTFYDLDGNAIGGSSACAAETLTDQEQDLRVLREFRDRVLARSPAGRGLVDLYYACSPAVVAALEQHPALKKTAADLLGSLIPVITKKERLIGQEGLRDGIIRFLSLLSDILGEGFDGACTQVRAAVDSDLLFGVPERGSR